MMRRDHQLVRWEEIIGRMLENAGEGSESQQRLRATLGFLEFIQEEVDGLAERWIKRKAEIDAENS
jgi:hypothetical protein